MLDISIRNHEGKIAVFTNGLYHDFFDTLEEAEACAAQLKVDNLLEEFAEEAIDDLRRALMGDPYNLDSEQADKAIKDEINF